MGRFSPTVTPTGVSPLGVALREGTSSFMESKERRRRARLQRQREERLQEMADLREDQARAASRDREIRRARQGFRPEGASERMNLEEASQPGPGVPASPIGDAGVPDRVPEDAGSLADALRTARGERQRRPFTPGDVREGLLPAAVAMEMEQRPGRISLPSGGSIPEVSPEVQRQREERSELAGLLQEGGFSEPRAEIAARTGSDMLAPGEPGEPVPSIEQLRAAGATDQEIAAVRGDPEGMRSLRDQLVGRRTSPDEVDIESTERFNQAIRLAEQGATLDEIQEQTGVSRVHAINAAQTAKEGEEASLSAFEEAANRRFDEPANHIEQVARDLFVSSGSEEAALERFDRRIQSARRFVDNPGAVDVPPAAIDTFVETGSLETIVEDNPDLTREQRAAITIQGLKRMRQTAEEYLTANQEAMANLRERFPALMMGGGG